MESVYVESQLFKPHFFEVILNALEQNLFIKKTFIKLRASKNRVYIYCNSFFKLFNFYSRVTV